MKNRKYVRTLTKWHEMDMCESILAGSDKKEDSGKSEPNLSLFDDEVDDQVTQYGKEHGYFGEGTHHSVWDD